MPVEDADACSSAAETAGVKASWHRLVVVHALIALVVGGHLWCIVEKREHWPLSPYPMYSHLAGGSYSLVRAYGVADGKEVPLDVRTHLEPFDPTRLVGALNRMKDAKRRRAAFEWILQRYEDLRAEGRHSGPPLDEIRVYRETWRVNPNKPLLTKASKRKLIHTIRTGQP